MGSKENCDGKKWDFSREQKEDDCKYRGTAQKYLGSIVAGALKDLCN
jgi:hypothetical protein